jgi:hypothetical protein
MKMETISTWLLTENKHFNREACQIHLNDWRFNLFLSDLITFLTLTSFLLAGCFFKVRKDILFARLNLLTSLTYTEYSAANSIAWLITFMKSSVI